MLLFKMLITKDLYDAIAPQTTYCIYGYKSEL